MMEKKRKRRNAVAALLTLLLAGCGTEPDPCKPCRDRGYACGSRVWNGETTVYCMVPLPTHMLPKDVEEPEELPPA